VHLHLHCGRRADLHTLKVLVLACSTRKEKESGLDFWAHAPREGEEVDEPIHFFSFSIAPIASVSYLYKLFSEDLFDDELLALMDTVELEAFN